MDDDHPERYTVNYEPSHCIQAGHSTPGLRLPAWASRSWTPDTFQHWASHRTRRGSCPPCSASLASRLGASELRSFGASEVLGDREPNRRKATSGRYQKPNGTCSWYSPMDPGVWVLPGFCFGVLCFFVFVFYLHFYCRSG